MDRQSVWTLSTLMVILFILNTGLAIQQKPKVMFETKMSSQVIDSLVQMNNLKDSVIKERNRVIEDWENHALRMKRIVGVPDTIAWSYKQKVVHEIDTKRLVGKHRIE